MPDLTQLLGDLWKKIKTSASSPVDSRITEDEIVVFVVGPTGSGKSWFAKAATKNDLIKVSERQHPSTTKVQAIRCELTDEAKKDLKEGVDFKSIVVVDTPSFLTGHPKLDAGEEIKKWFGKVKEYKPGLTGLIYMHRIEDKPGDQSIQAHLWEFSSILRICSKQVPPRVHVVPSYGSKLLQPKIDDHKSILRNQMESLTPPWKPSMGEEFFRGESNAAWKAIAEVLRDRSEDTLP